MGFTLNDNLGKMYKNSDKKPEIAEKQGNTVAEETKKEIDNFKNQLLNAINTNERKLVYVPKIKDRYVSISTILVYNRVYPLNLRFEIFVIAVEGKNMFNCKTGTYALKYLNNYYILKENKPVFHNLTIDIQNVTEDEIEKEIDKYRANKKYKLIEDIAGRQYFVYR